jgi:hypothetical protein
MDEYQIPEHLNARLKNWAHWAKVRRFPSHCRSIEHRYKPEAGDTWEPAPARVSVDLWDAYHVERTWAYLMPPQGKWILKAQYILAPVAPKEGTPIGPIWNAHIRRVTKALGIPRDGYHRVLYRACRQIEGLLGDTANGVQGHRAA